MNRIRTFPLLGTAALLATLAGCGGSDESGETSAAADTAVAANEVSPMPAPAPAPAAPADAQPGAMLDPNLATREELLSIPNLNPQLADAIIAARPHQDMRSVDRALAGLSKERRDAVYGRLWKPLDLNSATGEEILLVPGVGNRMRHEFEEYRPYRNIEQFRREIGKYVDKDEVARLERYVTIRQ
jgi:DNA uptake protein ComE-like DNA-binding protein